MSDVPVAILGAGLQGCTIALELAQRGLPSILLDQDPRPMNRASLRNEGKIHLGIVYANDTSRETARLMLRGALTFHPLMKRWLGVRIERMRLSTPFTYLVAQDSILTPEQLTEHYDAVDALCHEMLAKNPEWNYLGGTPGKLCRRLTRDEYAPTFSPEIVQAAFATEELAIDTDDLAEIVREAIAESGGAITFCGGHRVGDIARADDGFTVRGADTLGEPFVVAASQVVNCTWENRLALDGTLGLANPPGWVHRMKYRVIVRIAPERCLRPSSTMVIGRYGDVVIRPNATAYLSWYPLAMRGWSHELAPPEAWNAPNRGEVSTAGAEALSAQVVEKIATWFPEIAESEPLLVDAGAIFAYGQSDVDKRDSALHDRTRIGVQSFGGYHTVDTGKLTTAPLFALDAADRVCDQFGAAQ